MSNAIDLNPEVRDYVAAISNEIMRADCIKLTQIMHEETDEMPYMWGPSIVGFGTHHYKYESGREGDTVVVGFSPRKQALTLYGLIFYDQGLGRLNELGKYKAGKGCVYIKRLSDIDETVLREMIREAYSAKPSK